MNNTFAIKRNTTGVTTYIRVVDATTGDPKTDITAATAGLSLWYGWTRSSPATFPAVALAGDAVVWTSGGIRHIRDGWYRIDVPDAAFAVTDAVTGILVGLTLTGAICSQFGNHPLVNYNPNDAAGLGLSRMDAAISSRSILDQAGVRTAIGLSSPNMDARLDDLPTLSEFEARTLLSSAYATLVNQNSFLAKMGLITGAGDNTLLGFFKAALRSDFPVPSDLGGTYDPATDSQQALRDRGDAAWLTASGFATSIQATNIQNKTDLIPAAPATEGTASAARTAAEASQSVLDEMTAPDPVSGLAQYTAEALENGPSGGGSGGLTAAQDTKLTEVHTRTLLALPAAAPGTNTGLPVLTSALVVGADVRSFQGIGFSQRAGINLGIFWGNDGSGASIDSRIGQLTAARLAALDKLNVTGVVASATDVAAVSAKIDAVQATQLAHTSDLTDVLALVESTELISGSTYAIAQKLEGMTETDPNSVGLYRYTAGSLAMAPAGGGGGGGLTTDQDAKLTEIHAKTQSLGVGIPTTVISPVLSGGKLTLIQGFDWTAAEGGRIIFEEPAVAAWPTTIDSASLQEIYGVKEHGSGEFNGSGAFLSPLPDGRRQLQYEVTRDEIDGLVAGAYKYYLSSTFSTGYRIVFATGRLDLNKGPQA